MSRQQKVEKLFVDNGSTITNVENWGKKKLAYQIKKHDSALYVFIHSTFRVKTCAKLNLC
ncbi:30S ribosomal protein S6 [Candidatus Saccharibacteria bacterium]|nr:MAG: 30S ribosomal protein S6 [Candidatus Saccharibacteria bacterium]